MNKLQPIAILVILLAGFSALGADIRRTAHAVDPEVLRTINIYLPPQNWTFEFEKPFPIEWNRALIPSYLFVYIYIRRPDGSNAILNKTFRTASNQLNSQASGDILCRSGNCGLYYITAHKDTLLSSPNSQYYIEIRTMDDRFKGKSKLFFIK
jgi:hypothetical protein